jgi:DNA/RNA-binding domain of Phe-tRNA-synthetase-like protein
MVSISATDGWQKAHPEASIGILEISGIDNSRRSSRLDEQKREVEARLRDRYQGFTRQDFLTLPVMAAYDKYYARFDKTYHVQLQVESIILKGKNLPIVSALVDANFTAEVETFVLTAGHNADKLNGRISMDVSRVGDQMTQMNGIQKELRAGDMIMRDEEGICCSILYGQDNRSPITPQSTHTLYISYCPPGVPREALDTQLDRILEYIRLFAPLVKMEQRLYLSSSY